MTKLPPITLTCNRCGHDNYPCTGHGGSKRHCSCQLPGCVPEGKKRCGYSMTVPMSRPLTEAEARAADRSSSGPSIAPARRPAGGPDPALLQAWAAVPEWTDDDAAIIWRPDPKAGSCEQCGAACVAEPGRTMVCCPRCEWWADYPEVIAWRDRQHSTAAGLSTRGGPASMAETLAAQREHDVNCGRLERQITGMLAADKRLTADCREMLASYLRQVRASREAKDGPARLAALLEQYEREPIERRGWRGRFDDVGSYLAWLVGRGDLDSEEEDDDDVVTAELVGDDGLTDSERAAEQARPALALVAVQPADDVLCELCLPACSAAVARIFSPQAPWVAPERDVCLEHYRAAAALAGRMTFVNLEIIKRCPGCPPEVRSIIKVGAPATAPWPAITEGQA